MKRMCWMMAATFILVLFLAAAGAEEEKKAGAAAKTGIVKERAEIMTATVQAVDLEKRIVTLKGPKGEVRNIEVGDEAKNLDRIKAGDLVTVKYRESVAVEVASPGTTAGAKGKMLFGRTEPAGTPGGLAARQTTVTARVASVDKKKGSISVTGADGDTVVVRVTDRKNLEKVKVGDNLVITYTEAMAISVMPAKKK